MNKAKTIQVEILPATYHLEAERIIAAGGGATNDYEVFERIVKLAQERDLDVEFHRKRDDGGHDIISLEIASTMVRVGFEVRYLELEGSDG